VQIPKEIILRDKKAGEVMSSSASRGRVEYTNVLSLHIAHKSMKERQYKKRCLVKLRVVPHAKHEKAQRKEYQYLLLAREPEVVMHTINHPSSDDRLKKYHLSKLYMSRYPYTQRNKGLRKYFTRSM
jgi:hypothetical protein